MKRDLYIWKRDQYMRKETYIYEKIYMKRDLYIWKRDPYMRKEIYLYEKRPVYV